MTKIEKLEQLLGDLTANRIKRSEAERLFFIDAEGLQVRLASPDAAARLRARIEKEKGSEADPANA